MSVLLAYPHEHIEGRPVGDFITAVWDLGADWPRERQGPDPCDVQAAAGFMAVQLPEWCLALSEEAVLAAALANQARNAERGLGLVPAIAATDRIVQRETLPRELSPRWRPLCDGVDGMPAKLVVKAGCSTSGLGVEIVEHASDIGRAVRLIQRRAVGCLARLRQIREPHFLLEEYVEGFSFEVSGYSRDDVECVFRPLQQRWTEDGRIAEYIPHERPPSGLVDAAIRAVRALHLRWCGWCVELKGHPWRVIEVNARLGEDAGSYARKVSPGGCPVRAMCEALMGA